MNKNRMCYVHNFIELDRTSLVCKFSFSSINKSFENSRKICDSLELGISKLNSIFPDGISVCSIIRANMIRNNKITTFVDNTITYDREPNFYKLNSTKFILPVTPSRDVDMWRYITIHCFEPSFGMIKVTVDDQT